MPKLQQTVKAVVRPGDESGFVGECVEIAVVTQGQTIEETIRNLQEAVALHLDGEDPSEFGLIERPMLIVTMEIEPDYAGTS